MEIPKDTMRLMVKQYLAEVIPSKWRTPFVHQRAILCGYKGDPEYAGTRLNGIYQGHRALPESIIELMGCETITRTTTVYIPKNPHKWPVDLREFWKRANAHL